MQRVYFNFCHFKIHKSKCNLTLLPSLVLGRKEMKKKKKLENCYFFFNKYHSYTHLFWFQPLTIYHATQVTGLGSQASKINKQLRIHYLGMLASTFFLHVTIKLWLLLNFYTALSFLFMYVSWGVSFYHFWYLFFSLDYLGNIL